MSESVTVGYVDSGTFTSTRMSDQCCTHTGPSRHFRGPVATFGAQAPLSGVVVRTRASLRKKGRLNRSRDKRKTAIAVSLEVLC